MIRKNTENIDIDLKELIPGFISNTELEIKALEEAVVNNDMITVNRIGHNIKGTALNYGFVSLAEIGKGLERASDVNDVEKVGALLSWFREYFLTLEIIFEDV
ncbi:Hpt domain-containing protein [Maridesulfovibrio frigidus]|uniref:Hpt domain-containing protein n=1 Tax=Maridesulfovibrio frigidus TaxID=340956 RepID=UPI0004E135BB|nr:Hpt domain-containing protein [Maridesulfovibrio frigidus]